MKVELGQVTGKYELQNPENGREKVLKIVPNNSRPGLCRGKIQLHLLYLVNYFLGKECLSYS